MIVIAVLVALSSIPVEVNEVKVPTDVMFGCAAVVNVPARPPLDASNVTPLGIVTVSYTHLTLPTKRIV